MGRDDILSGWLSLNGLSRKQYRRRIRGMNTQAYDEWRLQEARRVGERVLQVLMQHRDENRLQNATVRCYMEVSELANRLVWGNGGGEFERLGPLRDFLTAVLRDVRVLHLMSIGFVVRLLDFDDVLQEVSWAPPAQGTTPLGVSPTVSDAEGSTAVAVVSAPEPPRVSIRDTDSLGSAASPSYVEQASQAPTDALHPDLAEPPQDESRLLLIVGITGPHGAGKAALAQELSERFTSPLGALKAECLRLRAEPLPDDAATTYGENRHYVHEGALSWYKMRALRHRLTVSYTHLTLPTKA